MARTRAQARMLKAVGLVAEQTALVEEEFRELLCCFLGLDGHVIGAGQTLGSLIEMTSRLANFSRLDDAEYERLIAILKAADMLRADRNGVIHSRWESAGAGGRHFKVQSKAARGVSRKPGVYGGGTMKPEDVTAIADGLEQVAEQLVAFRVDVFNIGYSTPPFPRGFRPFPNLT